jgi:hypothetical protein
MKTEQPGGSDERYVMGRWFESVADAVRTYPFRAGTDAAKVIHYDRSKVSFLSSSFNAASTGAHLPSQLERASAGKHVYTIAEETLRGEPDAKAVSYMQQRMKDLYTVCKRNGVGVVVHTPKPGLIQINLTPQTRPKLELAPRPRNMGPRPRKMRFDA